MDTIKHDATTLRYCPVIVVNDNDIEVNECGEELNVILDTSIVGDDYGSYSTYDINFSCGHTFAQMLSSIKIREYI